MTPEQFEYETSIAAKYGISLEAWLETRTDSGSAHPANDSDMGVAKRLSIFDDAIDVLAI